MKSIVRAGLGLIALSSAFFLFSGCSGDDDEANPGAGGGSATSGLAECEVIGELCHESDTGSGPAHECHEQAHHGNGAECLESFAGCISTCVADEGEGSEKDPRCAALGELCHPVDDDDGPLHECHELGHVNDAEACAAAFDDCATRCVAAREALEAAGAEGGAAGVGGAASSH
jgi:hypothetical protein